MDWTAKVLPVRVLGKCGGTFDDIVGRRAVGGGLARRRCADQLAPARVINMSLGGTTPCPQAMQDAIDAVLAQGAVIVVAAGQRSAATPQTRRPRIAAASSPSARRRAKAIAQAIRTSASRVDISAPGGDGDVTDWIMSTWNDGKTSPGNPIYATRDRHQLRRPARRGRGVADVRAQREPDARPSADHHHQHGAHFRTGIAVRIRR